jgi:hypothetical protein
MKRLLVALTLLALSVSGVAMAAGSKGKKTSGVVYAGATHAESQLLFVAGDINDKLLGRGAIVYITKLRADQPGTFVITAKKITIYTSKGSLTGTGKATQVTADNGDTKVKNGTFKLTKGTGAYKGHTLNGKFGGPLQDGVYKFNYTGTYR